MKISMIIDNLSVKGGYQKLVLRLSQQLKMLGYEVIIYTPIVDKYNCYPEIIKDFKIISASRNVDIFVKSTIIVKIKKFLQYLRLITKFSKSEVIVIHDLMSLIFLNFISTKNTKILWMLNFQLPDLLQKNKKITGFIKKIFSLLIKKGLKKVDLILAYDSYNNNLIKENLINKSCIVYAGADIEKKIINIKKQIDFPIKLLSVGVLFNYRRYEDIIEAMNILNQDGLDCYLKIVGEVKFSPEYLIYLKKIIKNYNLDDKVYFCGAINNEELDKLYRESDIFLFVNDAFTWGISVFEAMSYRLPIIMTDNIGAVDLLKDANCVFSIPPKSPKDIVKSIKEIKNNNEKIYRMVSLYDIILEKVSWSSFTKRIENAINSIKKQK